MISIARAPGDDKGERTIWLQDNRTLNPSLLYLVSSFTRSHLNSMGQSRPNHLDFLFLTAPKSQQRRDSVGQSFLLWNTQCVHCANPSPAGLRKQGRLGKKHTHDACSPQSLLVLYSAPSLGTTFTESCWEGLDTNAFVRSGQHSVVSLASKVPAFPSLYKYLKHSWGGWSCLKTPWISQDKWDSRGWSIWNLKAETHFPLFLTLFERYPTSKKQH